MLSRYLALILCPFAIQVWAGSTATVGGPVTGFVFDAQLGAIRPMLGIPGAAYLGAAVASQLDSASVSPDGSAALAVQAGRLLLYTGLGTQAPAVAPVAGAIAGIDHFAWAAAGGAAAVFSSMAGQAQILTGLGQSPAAGAPIDLSAIPGQVASLAFDGQRILIGVASADSGGIYLAAAQSPVQRIAPAVSPSAIVLAGADLYFADNQSQQIWQVKTYATSPAAVLFANDSGIASPCGMQVSADGRRLYVANADNRKLAVYDIASRSLLQSLDLDFTPARLDRFGESSVYLLNDTGKGPLYVLSDAGAQPPAVFFVPAKSAPRPRKVRIRPL
jgi:hypothetical protein